MQDLLQVATRKGPQDRDRSIMPDHGGAGKDLCEHTYRMKRKPMSMDVVDDDAYANLAKQLTYESRQCF